MDLIPFATKLVEGIVEEVGIEPIVALIAARTSRDQAIALLDAQYNLQRARVDAEAARELRPGVTKVVP